jgi:hypothetical protein
MVKECRKQGIQAVGLLHFASAPKEFAQAMSPEEEERFNRMKADTPSDYQYGGEPIHDGELLLEDSPWCFDRPEALEYAKREIDRLIAEGCDAIAFDYIGYKNYHACFCPVSKVEQKRYLDRHPGLSEADAINSYSRDRLISFYKAIINCARIKKPNVVLTAHVYPYFSPDPFYGTYIPLDYCGQTVSWFFNPHWDYGKICRYASRTALAGRGAAFIGVYTLHPYEKHRKSPERLREEIRIVKASGCQAIQMAELGNILNDPALASVVREELSEDYFGANQAPGYPKDK